MMYQMEAKLIGILWETVRGWAGFYSLKMCDQVQMGFIETIWTVKWQLLNIDAK